MRRNRALLLGILLGVAGPAAADDAYTACVDATASNQAWAQCGGAYIAREEARMDEAWQRLMELTEGDTTAALKAEQDAWTQFREKACQFYADAASFGREGQVLSFPSCVAEAIAGRTEQLKGYLREIDP